MKINQNKYFLFFFSFFLGTLNLGLGAWNLVLGASNVDSLLTLLKTDKGDTTQVIHLYQLCDEYCKTGDIEKGLQYGNAALVLAKKNDFKKGISYSYNIIGIIYWNQGNYPEALKNFFASLRILEEIGDKKGISYYYNNIGVIYWEQGNYPEALKNYFASLSIKEELLEQAQRNGNPPLAEEAKKGIAMSYNNIGIIYKEQGNYPEALKNYFASLKIFEELGDKKGIAASYNSIGNIYYAQGNYPEALKNHFASLKIREELGDKNGIGYSYNNIGIIYWEQGNYPEALKNYFASLSISEELGDKKGIADSYHNIGIIYNDQGNYPEVHQVERDSLFNLALKNYFASLKIFEELGDKKGIAYSYINLGSLYTKTGKLKEAKDYLTRGLALSMEIGSKERIKGSYSGLSWLDSATGNYGNAYLNYKLSMAYNDSLFSEEKSETMGKLEARHEFALIEMEMALRLRSATAEKEAAIKRRDKIQFTGLAGILLVVVLIVALLFFSKFNIAPKIKTGSLFIALVLLFEFMLVWFDPSIEKFTGGNPAYKLFLNALLALGFYFVQQVTVKWLPVAQTISTVKVNTIGMLIICAFSFAHLCGFSGAPSAVNKILSHKDTKSTKVDSLKLLLSQYEIQSTALHSQNKMKEAFETIKKYGNVKDSLQKLEQSQEEAKVKERQAMEIQKKKQKQEEDEKAMTEKGKKERTNLLIYSGLLIFIIILFVGLVSAKKFQISNFRFQMPHKVLEGGLFVSFLLFFEFILVFADPYIEQYTGGAPGWKFGFNVVLAGLIFPVHGWLEGRMKNRLRRHR